MQFEYSDNLELPGARVDDFGPQVLQILLNIPLNGMLIVTLAAILSIWMNVSFTVENSSSLIFFTP